MKQYVKSANDDNMPGQYNQLANEAFVAGYDFIFKDVTDIQLVSDKENYPEIRLYPNMYSDGSITYNVRMKFPELYGDESSNYRDLSYYMLQWSREVSPFVEELMKFEYLPNE